MKEDKFPNTSKPSHRWVYKEFWNLRGQHNWEEKKKKNPTDDPPNCNSQWRSSPEAQMIASTTSKQGLNREARAAFHRVRTGPECPEDNLRELM